MESLTGKSLLKKEELEIVQVDLGKNKEGKKEFVFVRQMTGREREQFEKLLVKRIKKGGKVVEY